MKQRTLKVLFWATAKEAADRIAAVAAAVRILVSEELREAAGGKASNVGVFASRPRDYIDFEPSATGTHGCLSDNHHTSRQGTLVPLVREAAEANAVEGYTRTACSIR